MATTRFGMQKHSESFLMLRNEFGDMCEVFNDGSFTYYPNGVEPNFNRITNYLTFAGREANIKFFSSLKQAFVESELAIKKAYIVELEKELKKLKKEIGE